MNQLNLFGETEPSLARRSDPNTSHEAAAEIKKRLGPLHREFLERLGDKEMTAQEVARGNESIRKRAKELERKGLIRVTCERVCRRTGKRAQVYSKEIKRL